MDLATVYYWLEGGDILNGTFTQREAEAPWMKNHLYRTGRDGIVAMGMDSPQGHSTIGCLPVDRR
jgi:hypothetical protein